MNKSSAVDIKPAYINSNDLVLDPKLIEKPLLERMPIPTGWRLLVLPYKGKGKRKIKKLPFTVKGYILYYAFFWVVIISIYLAYY